LVPDFPEYLQDFIVGPGGFRRIREPDVRPETGPQPNRTFLRRIVADGDDPVEINALKIINMLRRPCMDDPDFRQDREGEWVNGRRGCRACACRMPPSGQPVIDERFRHLRTA
jgi:hypothetical protein